MGIDTASLSAAFQEDMKAIEETARGAAQAGAQVFYDAARANAGAIRKSGNLQASIYQKYITEAQPGGVQSYKISVRSKGTGPEAYYAGFVEFGYLQRYKYYRDEGGKIRPMVRPEMQGKPAPAAGSGNRAKLAAYYVTLDTPKQVPARPFMQPAYTNNLERAGQAMAAKWEQLLTERGVLK
jgi:HK97 gp10 family phage protein